jgi:hypothetical protein
MAQKTPVNSAALCAPKSKIRNGISRNGWFRGVLLAGILVVLPPGHTLAHTRQAAPVLMRADRAIVAISVEIHAVRPNPSTFATRAA